MENLRILDLLDSQPNPPPLVRGKRKHRVRRGAVVERKPSQVDTIMLHQTACTFGKRSDQLTRHHRALGVACHNLAFADGVMVRANPLSWYVYHGNGFNSRSLGVEAEGSFPGLMDDPDTPRREDLATHWGDDGKMTEVTDLLVETTCLAISDLVKRALIWGAEIRYIVAHRQGSANRRSDPGEGLWKRVVLDWAVPELGLETRPDWVKGSGYPVPKAWDSQAGVGRY